MPTNWRAWLSGAIAAIANGSLTGLSVVGLSGDYNLAWKMALIEGGKGFFLYIKQSPMPASTVIVKKTDTSTMEVTKE